MNDRPDPFTVTGEAAFSIPPQLTIISVGLDVVKPTASEALQESANIMDKVINAILALGVTKDELETTNLQVQEKFETTYDTNGASTTKSVGFEVTQSLNIKTRLVDQAGAYIQYFFLYFSIVDACINNGMNRVDNVSYDATEETKKKIQDSLISEAIKNAEAKALKAVSAIGYVLKGIKTVSLGGYDYFTPSGGEIYKSY